MSSNTRDDRNPFTHPVAAHAAVSRSQTLFAVISEVEPVGRVHRGKKMFRGVKRKKLTEAGGPMGSGEDLQCGGGGGGGSPSGLDRRMCDD